MSRLSEYAKFAAGHIHAVEQIAVEHAQEIRDRVRVLMDDPIARNDYLTEWFVRDGFDKMAASTGNSGLARAYWSAVAELADRPMTELAETPVEKRDDIWSQAASIILAVSKLQARIESSVVQEIMARSIDVADERKRALARLTPEEIAANDYLIKDELRALKHGAVPAE
jgi:hypothetical protein